MKKKKKVYRYDTSKKIKRNSDEFDEEYSNEFYEQNRQLALQKLATELSTKKNKKDKNC